MKLKSENGVLGQYIENLMQVQEGKCKDTLVWTLITTYHGVYDGQEDCTVICAFYRPVMCSKQSAQSPGGKKN